MIDEKPNNKFYFYEIYRLRTEIKQARIIEVAWNISPAQALAMVEDMHRPEYIITDFRRIE